jgi:beta-galactosidase GanA
LLTFIALFQIIISMNPFIKNLMPKIKNFFWALLLFTLPTYIFSQQNGNESQVPVLKKQGSATQLIVDGKPFLMMAGELGNSSASDMKYMESVWPKLVLMNLNTLLVPIYWELLEPIEGKYDFTLIDCIIKDARRYNIKVVLLWFGSWKNSMSCYAPLWVKTDPFRFLRAKSSDGKSLDILSPFCVENMTSDAKAFKALMRHIKEIDFKNHTVLMIQVENEIGMIPEPRDYNELAQKAYNSQVPVGLINYLSKNMEILVPELLEYWDKNGFKTSGTWEDVFGKGPGTEELFTAWYFARYTNYVASVGKAEYSLPMFINAALNRKGYKPGQYPSGGPLPHLINIWQTGAPTIDFLSPDIYFPDLTRWCNIYDRLDNPMFIPEADNSQSMANAFYVIGQHNSMGYSPFSIESLNDPGNSQVTKAYDVLHQLEPIILEKQGKEEIKAVLLDSASQSENLNLGNFTFHVKHEYSWPYASKAEGSVPRFGCMIIMLLPNEFLVAGSGVVITFDDNTGRGLKAGINSIEEGKFIENKWIPGRRLNGDETHQGRHLHLDGFTYGIRKLKLYSYK